MEVDSDARTVSNFIRNAFPVSTIPVDNRKPFRDYSFNYADYPHWSTGKSFIPKEIERRSSQWPIWPADLFGVTSALLERSAAYQRLANAVKPLGSAAAAATQWKVILNPASADDDDDPFGVRDPHRLLLRFIGALWGHGALLISGLYSGKQLLDRTQIVRQNRRRAREAVDFIYKGLAREIAHPDLEQAQQAIYDQVSGRLGLHSEAPDFEAVAGKEPGLRSCAAAVLAFDAIRAHDQDYRNGDVPHSQEQIQLHYKGDGQLELRHYCFIVWASEYIQYHWNVLRRSQRPISLGLSDGDGTDNDLAWWRAAIRLLIIADEAGKGMGFSLKPSRERPEEIPFAGPEHLQAGLDCRTIWEHYGQGRDQARLGPRLPKTSMQRFPRTLTRSFEEELGSVLPKAHTPMTGCTIRSLSHNFALLPPKGRIRARWARQSRPNDKIAYNILIIPYPYQIKSKHVASTSEEDSLDDWGFFRIKPDWLYEPAEGNPAEATTRGFKSRCHKKFWMFLTGLLDDQAHDTVHAVVLPEGALDWETFAYVQARLPKEYPSIGMLVCGLTSARLPGDAKPMHGNFVATYMRTAESKKRGVPWWPIRHVRSKHHRWRLDATQLGSYALSHRLAPNKIWWEDIKLPHREMLFAEFCAGSVLTTLICEDLARIEPCQVALRAVGPNLVLVLLMDTAQIVQRWPYQYAGVLADDPGSSVLTLTSFGLVKRSNLSEDRNSRQIGIWREPHAGPAREISLPVGYDAQLVSIRRDYCFERSLDGRGDNFDAATVWKFAGLIPIRSSCPPPGGRPDG